MLQKFAIQLKFTDLIVFYTFVTRWNVKIMDIVLTSLSYKLH